ncbi:MAG: HAD-IA family hydrolase [Leptospiraceae bacterium]|nr:HAD-IA family hydrolase [Leptospiraceae bacterium]
MKIAAVLFDLDGTLAETELAHLECFNYAFQEFQLPFQWSKELYSELLMVGGGLERIKYYLQHFQPHLQLSHEEIKKIHTVKTECYKSKINKPVPLRIGVLRVLKELVDNKIKIALVTTSSKESTDAFLAHSLPSFVNFDLVITGNDVENKKPHPELYLKSIQRLNVNPENAIVVEDSRMGLLSGVRANLRVLITPSIFTNNHAFHEAYSVISHLGEPDNPFQHLLNRPLPKNFVDLEVFEYILKN